MNRVVAVSAFLVMVVGLTGCPRSDNPDDQILTDASWDRPADSPQGETFAGIDGPSDSFTLSDAGEMCACGPGRSCPAGAIYATACVICKCGSNGSSGCQAAACPDAGEPAEPPRCEDNPAACPSTGCVFDQGCEQPRAYCALTACAATFTQTFCGCDGVTFTTDCPRKPYRHVGACR